MSGAKRLDFSQGQVHRGSEFGDSSCATKSYRDAEELPDADRV